MLCHKFNNWVTMSAKVSRFFFQMKMLIIILSICSHACTILSIHQTAKCIFDCLFHRSCVSYTPHSVQLVLCHLHLLFWCVIHILHLGVLPSCPDSMQLVLCHLYLLHWCVIHRLHLDVPISCPDSLQLVPGHLCLLLVSCLLVVKEHVIRFVHAYNSHLD